MATILVIDDDKDTRELFHAILAHVGHHVVLARDGEEGIDLARMSRPDVVVADIFMPRKDGIETIGEVRRLLPNAKIVAVSAGWNVRGLEVFGRPIDTDVLLHARMVGATAWLAKPVDPARLVEVVTQLLSGAYQA